MSKRKKGTVYQRRIFAYFMAIAVVPLLILGNYSYFSAVKALRKNAKQANEASLMQIENQTEKALDAIRQSFQGLAMRESTVKMINRSYEEIPYPEIRGFIDEIYSEEAYTSFVKSYAFVNFKKGWIISNKGVITADQVKNRDWLKEIESSDKKIYWQNQTEGLQEQEELLSEYINHEYLTFVVKMPMYTPHSEAAFIVNLKQEAMEQIFKGSLGNGRLIVFDQEGRLVYSDNEALAEYYKNKAEAVGNLQEVLVHTADGTYDIVKRRALVSGWTFIAGYNSLAAEGELHQIILTMIIMIAVILLLTGILGSFGTLRVYRPVKKLVSEVKGMMPGQEESKEEDEFNLINQGLHALAGHNEELQGLIERQKGQLSELFALRLIRGRLGEGEIIQTLERLKLTPQPCLCVVSVLFCQKNGGAMGQLEQDVFNMELMKRLPDEIRHMLVFPPFIHTRAIVMVPDALSREKLEEKLLALRNCLSVFVNGECKGCMNMGVSRSFTELGRFRTAYHESLEALKANEHSDRDEDTEGISMEDSSVTYYEDLAAHAEGASGYNLALDEAVKEAVDHCSQEEAVAIVSEFLHDLNKSKAALYEQHYYLHRFLLAILTVPADAGIPMNDLFPEGEEDVFQQLNQLYDYRAIYNFYENKVIVPVVRLMSQMRKSSSEMVLEKVMELVENCKGDLTLTECAQKLGYHPSYIWRVLKNTKDITFTDYIAEQKLELAKKLLVETELSVAEIADRLSYSNAQNFIRLFKKHLEITPGQYRKQNKNTLL